MATRQTEDYEQTNEDDFNPEGTGGDQEEPKKTNQGSSGHQVTSPDDDPDEYTPGAMGSTGSNARAKRAIPNDGDGRPERSKVNGTPEDKANECNPGEMSDKKSKKPGSNCAPAKRPDEEPDEYAG